MNVLQLCCPRVRTLLNIRSLCYSSFISESAFHKGFPFTTQWLVTPGVWQRQHTASGGDTWHWMEKEVLELARKMGLYIELWLISCHSVSLFWWLDFSSERYTKGVRGAFISVPWWKCSSFLGESAVKEAHICVGRHPGLLRQLWQNCQRGFFCPSCPLRICRELDSSVRGVWIPVQN